MRLKFWSLSLLDHQNMPKPIPHCSNFRKIIFLKKGQSKNLFTNKYLMSRPHVGLLHWNLSWPFTFIILLMRTGVRERVKHGVVLKLSLHISLVKIDKMLSKYTQIQVSMCYIIFRYSASPKDIVDESIINDDAHIYLWLYHLLCLDYLLAEQSKWSWL